MHLLIFFEGLDRVPEADARRISAEVMEDREKLIPIWGRIMSYSTTIENILKEHLTCKNEKKTLGDLITLFETDCRTKGYTAYSKLISTLKRLNDQCRILWAHGSLTYSLKTDGGWTKHLIYANRDAEGDWVETKVEIGNDYFDQANIIYKEVIDEIRKMMDDRDSQGNLILKRQTSFIIPMQDPGKIDFIFVK